MNGYLRRTNLDLERHDGLPLRNSMDPGRSPPSPRSISLSVRPISSSTSLMSTPPCFVMSPPPACPSLPRRPAGPEGLDRPAAGFDDTGPNRKKHSDRKAPSMYVRALDRKDGEAHAHRQMQQRH